MEEKNETEKAKKIIDEEHDVVPCIIIDDVKPVQDKKKVSFADDVIV